MNIIICMINTTSAQLLGSQNNNHGCIVDGGYQWCQSLNQCIRPWETVCPPITTTVSDPAPVPVPVPAPVPLVDTSSQGIPSNCVSWFDGCNHCMVRNSQIVACSQMICITQGTPTCLSYNNLNIGEICYRYCEDNTEPIINRMNDCPQGSICIHRDNVVGYDSCGNNAWRCILSH